MAPDRLNHAHHPDVGSAAEAGTAPPSHLSACLERLRQGDLTVRETLVGMAVARMHDMAHRMLRRFPVVRRWEETDDVVQRAALRLHRSLLAVVPEDSRRFFGLAALQIRRTLLDLARSYTSPESFAAHHDTNHMAGSEEHVDALATLAAPGQESAASVQRWTRFHEAAAALPDEERELFDLVWYMGMQQRDVAEVLGCSVRTVKRRWESVKALLRDAAGNASPLRPEGP